MTSRLPNRSRPLLYLITDRHKLDHRIGRWDQVLCNQIREAVEAGVDLIQIRERDLCARDLCLVAESAAIIARGSNTRVLVNDRADVAAAYGIGVHLTTKSMRAATIRRAFGSEVLIGVSTHSLDEVEEAEAGGADFVVFGPVFETESKKRFGPPLGLRAVAEATAKSSIPLLALGGITIGNFHQALDAGASGIAAISLFAETHELARIVQTIKAYNVP